MAKSSHRHFNHIKRFRLEKGLTQRELARIMGYQSVSSLSHLENGRKLPSLKTALKLEIALQRFIGQIFPRLYDAVRTTVAQRRTQVFEARVTKRKDYESTQPIA